MKNPIKINQSLISKALFTGAAIFLFSIFYTLKLSLAIPVLLLIIFIYLKVSYKIRIRHLALKIVLLVALLTATSYSIVNYSQFSHYLIPVATISMLVVILFNDLKLAFAVTLFCAIETAAIASNNFALSVVFLTGGLVASLCVWQARRRAQIIKAGIITGVIQALCFMLFFSFSEWNLLKINLLHLIINGVASAGLVIFLLPLFEYLFEVATNISLLELSDFNQPLLKRMILEAPGTYQHSLVVGSISEIACESIGANALLARVGAYYHDIGKLEKPEYFSENQEINLSKHDKILPTISKMIIVNHVKEGAVLAKKYKLNPLIIDFISQHHGTSLTYYFYCRALEDMKCEENVTEEGFRYPGPKPKTKEIAVVMLADSIEAATRTLDEPTPQRIEESVRKIINNKFIDGQLDDCELTLQEINKIATTFIRVLGAMYHSRVKYPAS